MKWLKHTLLITVLIALALAGCRGKKEPTATPAPTPPAVATKAAPTATPAPKKPEAAEKAPTPTPKAQEEPPTPTPAQEVAEPSEAAEALKALGTYRTRLTADWSEISANETTTYTMKVLEEYVADEQAYRMIIRMTSSDKPEEAPLERIVIGKDQWLRMEDQWIYTPVEEEQMPMFIEELTPENLLNDLGEARLVKSGEEINGIKTQHYAIDKDHLTSSRALLFAKDDPETLQDVEIEAFQADLWIAEDGGYLVKFEVQESFTQGAKSGNPVRVQGAMTYEVYDVGADIKIEPPTTSAGSSSESAGESGVPIGQAGMRLPGFEEGGMPLPEGATIEMAMGEMQILTVPQPLKDVAAFYDQILTQAGWTKAPEGSYESDEAAMLSYQKDGVTISLSLTWAADEQQTQVMLVVGEP
ncbi:MAG: hypothetical protein GXP39_10235 [Chloroflexi bacterium]|nr:hypothetical protein [Chloroflexota bacterium]